VPASANTGTWGTAPQWKRDHAGQSGATNPQGDASTNGVEHYYHVDHLGTSQRLTNTQGETTWRMVSEAFGKTFVDATLAPTTTGTTTNNLRFPGQYEDQETGTHYNYFRDYDPSVGRYVQSDPIGLRGGINTYAYVKGNPLKYIDPRGLDVWAGGEGGFTAQTPILIGGAASMGVLRNLSTGETCPYIMICPRLGLGMQLSAGFKVGVQSGPKCGKALTDFGLQVAADIVSPAGGVGANVGVGDRKLSGAGAGIGPGWGLGASIAFEFCWTVVNSAACKNTPCECQK
jgi:RHS repeat-associated protein